MGKFWDTLAVIVLGTIIAVMLLEAVRPYIGPLVVLMGVIVFGLFMYRRSKSW